MLEEKQGLVNDPKDPNGNPPEIDPDNPKPEDIKNLQSLLSKRDVELKESQKKVIEFELTDKKKKEEKEKEANAKKSESDLRIEKMNSKIENLSGEIKEYNNQKRSDKLAKEYPDILPELLVGKSDEQIEKIVEKQRAKNKELYGDSNFFIKPKYENAGDVQKEIDDVKKDKNLRGDNAAIKVLHLIREKAKL